MLSKMASDQHRSCALALQLAAAATVCRGLAADSDDHETQGEAEKIASLLRPVLQCIADANKPWMSVSVFAELRRCAEHITRVRRLITDASSAEEILEVLVGEARTGSPAVFPLELLSVQLGHGIGRDATEHQAIRDVERDSFVVNGEAISGCQGFETVVKSLISASASTASVAIGEDTASTAARTIVISLLRVGNRTISGGDAFEAVSLLLNPHSRDGLMPRLQELHDATSSSLSSNPGGCSSANVTQPADGWDADGWPEDNVAIRSVATHEACTETAPRVPVVIVADSMAAPPISFTMDFGPYVPRQSSTESAGSTSSIDDLAHAAAVRVGIRCCIRATTVYRVMVHGTDESGVPSEGTDLTQLCRVSATYVAFLAWPLEAAASPSAMSCAAPGESTPEECIGLPAGLSVQRCGHGGRIEIEIVRDAD